MSNVSTQSTELTPPPAAAVSPLWGAVDGSQIAIANQFTDMVKDRLRYVAAERQWYTFDGSVWRQDKTLRVRDMIRAFLGKMSLEAPGAEGMWRVMASEKMLAGVERICQANRLLAATADQWDRDPNLLCTPDGMVDLTTGELRPARPEDYCRQITAVGPAPPGTPLGPYTRQVLAHICSGDMALLRYYQKAVGYCAFGEQFEKAVFIIRGETDSGKTTFWKAVGEALGLYATTANAETFLEDPKGLRTSTNDVAELEGYRLVVCGEPSKDGKLSAARLKRMIGRDKQKTRKLYQQEREWEPRFTPVMHCNEIPRHDTSDKAVTGRLRILPGGKSVPPSQQNHQLPALMWEEAATLLRFIIDGAVLCYQEGLGELPEAAKAVATEYERRDDPILAWHDDRTERVAGQFTPTDDLHRDYEAFVRDTNGGVAVSKDQFAKLLKEVRWLEKDANGVETYRHYDGPTPKRIGGKLRRCFIGLRLRPPVAPTDDDVAEDELPY